MEEKAERYERWTPLEGLPEAPLSKLDCTFIDDILTVTAEYAGSGRGYKLQFQFGYVEAFKLYEEFSDPWMGTGLALPQLVGPDCAWHWPLCEVINSTWVARVMLRNGGLDSSWHHFSIVTQDRTLHIMTGSMPRLVNLVRAKD